MNPNPRPRCGRKKYDRPSYDHIDVDLDDYISPRRDGIELIFACRELQLLEDSSE